MRLVVTTIHVVLPGLVSHHRWLLVPWGIVVSGRVLRLILLGLRCTIVVGPLLPIVVGWHVAFVIKEVTSALGLAALTTAVLLQIQALSHVDLRLNLI
jgi:hypothetical protein